MKKHISIINIIIIIDDDDIRDEFQRKKKKEIKQKYNKKILISF